MTHRNALRRILSHPPVTALDDGLTEEIIAGLSRFTYLKVIGLGALAKADSNATDARTVGTKLGARYLVDGSLRPARHCVCECNCWIRHQALRCRRKRLTVRFSRKTLLNCKTNSRQAFQ
jgi:hypothetical protein